ncbi:acyl CoA:acetate/3-ketoacid CoA transferase [Hugenholtzia roseola]|uniref:acyl CoA:acetate/3-ketoacid CoA transferase n=1 Tax=Hugenholtzia roseola TaxID=1002 RepID=UPI00040F0C79|nr:acyl CoA:acetate/3-ketoacid CoA transferase [Hugenholtzia roseola]
MQANRNKIVSAQDAASLVQSGDLLVTGGFVGIGFPEALAIALQERFLNTGYPQGLTLFYAAGQGDGKTRGLNHLAYPTLIKRVIGGHWGLVPQLGQLVLKNQIEGYNLPQGVISHLFRDIAAAKAGTISKVGLHTFVDPRIEGGKMNNLTEENLVELVELAGEEYLFYKAPKIDVAFLRGTTADEAGNITMEKEALSLEALAIAQAAKNSGGIVIVQVERVTTRHKLHPQMVVIPSILVDAVVIAPAEHHQQTFSETYNPAYTGDISVPNSLIAPLELDERKIIARRAAQMLKINSIVNLGIGMPEGVASVANEENILDFITLTVEPGGIGGIPASGLSFGAVANAQAIISQPSQFDFYDGGGLDQAFLGMAEVDREGNVNVSRFHNRIAGAGGFINISQNAKAVYFLGTFAAKAQVEVQEGALKIVEEGTHFKFVEKVGQITFSGKYAQMRKQTVYYITERAVFKLVEGGLLLIEIAKGIDLEKDVLEKMAFLPQIAPDLKQMDSRLFAPALMKLRREEKLDFSNRVHYNASNNTLFLNLEGISLFTAADVPPLQAYLVSEYDKIGRKFNIVVNYDNFFIGKDAEPAYFEILKHNTEKYFLSATRYSTNAFFRRSEAANFAAVNAKLYASSLEALQHL